MSDIADRLIACAEVYESFNKTWIYFLWSNGEVVYVGQTSNMKQRCLSHERSGKVFDKVTRSEVSKSQADDAEAACIVRFMPKYNVVLPGNSRYRTINQLKKDGIDRSNLLKVSLRVSDGIVNHYYDTMTIKESEPLSAIDFLTKRKLCC